MRMRGNGPNLIRSKHFEGSDKWTLTHKLVLNRNRAIFEIKHGLGDGWCKCHPPFTPSESDPLNRVLAMFTWI